MSKRKYSWLQYYVLIFISVFLLSCNIWEHLADKETDEALLFEAKILMNKSQWTEAIALFGKMSTEFLALDDVIVQHASAYSGRCSLDFLSLVDSLTNIGVGRIFPLVLAEAPGVAQSNIDDCETAELLIKSIDPLASNRTLDENVFMAMNGMIKLGVVMSAFGDTDDNGTVDPGFDPCNSVGPPPIITDANIDLFITGLANALESLTEVAASSTIGGGALADINGVCPLLDVAFGAPNNPCNATDAGSITATMRRAARTLINEGTDVGLSTCAAGTPDVPNCICP